MSHTRLLLSGHDLHLPIRLTSDGGRGWRGGMGEGEVKEDALNNSTDDNNASGNPHRDNTFADRDRGVAGKVIVMHYMRCRPRVCAQRLIKV